MIKTINHGYRVLKASLREIKNTRSPKWPAVEQAFLKLYPTCAACGGKENLQCHHIIPFSVDPRFELDPANLITMCMAKDSHCHLLVAHGGKFASWSETIRQDAIRALEFRNQGDAAGLEDLIAEIKQNRKSKIK